MWEWNRRILDQGSDLGLATSLTFTTDADPIPVCHPVSTN